MKHLLRLLAAVIVVAAAFPFATASAQNTNNFVISSFDIAYDLSRDSEQRSILKTTEKIVAEFPQSNQNHGLERAIPKQYDGHSTSLHIDSITDGAGNTLEYSTSESTNAVLVLRIGDPDTYVHGTQTYEITYTQRDVTKFYADNQRDEWYWDTNGTEWKVPINRQTVQVTFDESLRSILQADPACYSGLYKSQNRCDLQQQADGSYTVEAANLVAGENITVAFGFPKDTFGLYQESQGEVLFRWWMIVSVSSGVIAFIVFISLMVAYTRRRNRVSELGPIPAEYIPPRDASVSTAALVITPTGSVFAAQLIDLAVRHYITIVETKPKSTWKTAEYDLRIERDVRTLLAEELELLTDMFGKEPKVGDSIALSSLRMNMAYITRTSDNAKKLTALVEEVYKLREKNAAASTFFYRWSIALLILGLVTLSPFTLILAGILALFANALRPLTDKGLKLRRYILGLDKYIKAAEAERLKMFQAPDTAEKVGEAVDPNNSGQILKLYERVLPYAILFNREKQWSKQLGELYIANNTTPDWYSGQAAFNAFYFSSALSSFSQTAAYSGGANSGSSGSGGGGSSGGGGGGGGGGGW